MLRVVRLILAVITGALALGALGVGPTTAADGVPSPGSRAPSGPSGVSVWNSRRAHKAEVAGVPLEYDTVDRHDKRLAMLSIGLYAIAVAATFVYFLV